MKRPNLCAAIGPVWARVCAERMTWIEPINWDAFTPEPGSRAELVGALMRFRDAVAREPHRQLVRVLHS